MSFIKKNWLKILFVILFIIKCWMVCIQPIMIKGFDHDDGMFMRLATNIVNGNWLGEYNDMTLSKGVTGILFLAINYKLNISYLLATQCLYFVACIVFVRMLRHITKNKIVLFVSYIILLFNPISFSDAVSFVYRDGIYISFILLLIGLTFEMFFHYKDRFRKIILYQLFLGLDLGAIYLCREETVWILPYLILAFAITILFIIFDKECSNKFHRIVNILSVPIIIVLGYVFIIININYKYYGRYVTNDFTSKDFKDAYGALTRVKPTNYIKRVPLNSIDRKRLYILSPTFKKLENFLEGSESSKHRYTIYKDGKEYRDYKEGFLYWAIREAVYRNGYYINGKTAKAYYQILADEINELCDSNVIECSKKRSSLIAPFQEELKEELIKYVPKTFYTQLNYKYVLVEIPDFKVKNQGIDSQEELNNIYNRTTSRYKYITHNKTSYTKSELNSYNMKLMKFILTIFQNTNFILFIISLGFYFFIMVVSFLPKTKFKYYKQVFLINGLLCIYLSRIAVVSYIAATEYESAIERCQYLSSIYPIQSMFSVLCIIFGVQILYEKARKRLYVK